VGETPNLAARLQAAAGPGQVVIAEGTRRLVGDLFELAGPESRTLKGLAGPVPSWRVAGEHPGISRFEARRGGRWTPLVGRDQELALLLDRWDLARGGEGQAVLLCGEPGIGKSRLAAATAEALDGQEHTVLRYQCSPQYSGSSLWPVCQQLAAAARLDRAAASSEQLFRLEQLLRRSVPEPGDAPRLLGELLGIPIDDPLPDLTAQQKRGRVLAALVDQLLGLGRRMPVLVLFEDVHWIDPTSLELVERTLEAIGATRGLFVMTCRPDNQPPFGGHPHLTRVTLNRLGRAAAEAIVTRLVADRALSGLVRDRILAQTDGVPLFIEELTKAVLEAGVEGMTVPASLHDLLMARLDRSADVRHLAQAAACIGREFDHGLLASIVDMPDPDLDAAMGELVRAELVSRRGTPPAAGYSFKHALARDAAHHSLLKSRRRELHERVARALEGRPDAVGAPEIVAHHLSEAEIADDAVGWWLVAGRRAIGHSAYVEAARHLERGLADAARLAVGPSRTDRELELYAALGNALIFAKGFAAPETAWAFAEARRRCGQLDDTRQIAAILYGGWVVHVVRAEHEAAYRVATELSERLEGTSDPVALIIGHRLLGVSSHFLGRTTDALDHFERLLALRVPADDGDPIGTHAYDPYVVALSFSCHALLRLGQLGEAQQRIRAALARARELADPATVAFALWRACIFASIGRTNPGTGEEARELCAIAAEYRFPYWAAVGRVFRGRDLLRQGAWAEAAAEIAAGLADQQSSGARLALVHDLVLLAEARAAAGDLEAALALLDDALGHADRSGERWYDAELPRSRAAVLRRLGRDGDAAVSLARAVDVARSQGARLWELRGAHELARLWRDQGRCAEARNILKPVYGRFTEGFDKPDLEQAEALLRELA